MIFVLEISKVTIVTEGFYFVTYSTVTSDKSVGKIIPYEAYVVFRNIVFTTISDYLKSIPLRN